MTVRSRDAAPRKPAIRLGHVTWPYEPVSRFLNIVDAAPLSAGSRAALSARLCAALSAGASAGASAVTCAPVYADYYFRDTAVVRRYVHSLELP